MKHLEKPQEASGSEISLADDANAKYTLLEMANSLSIIKESKQNCYEYAMSFITDPVFYLNVKLPF